MDIRHYVSHGPFPDLGRALRRWVRLMSDPTWFDGNVHDAPWWYGERASTSQLAAALWLSKGWAMEEYSASRLIEPGRRRMGRGDLILEAGKTKLVCEAKQVWPFLTASFSLKTATRDAHRNASDQVRTLPTAALRYRRATVVFIVPHVARTIASKDDEYVRRLGNICDEARKLKNTAVAYAFPEHARQLATKKRGARRYPGVVLLVRPVPHPGRHQAR